MATTIIRDDRRGTKTLYWGIALAVIVVLAIAFMARNTSRYDTAAPTIEAPATTTPVPSNAPIDQGDTTINR